MANVIINCDDFGMNADTNANIQTLFKLGLISSCTAMVNSEFSTQAALIAKVNGFTSSIGLHFNVTEGRPLTKAALESSLLSHGQYFHGNFRIRRILKSSSYSSAVNYLRRRERKILKAEFYAQVDKFRNLFGVLPSHIDSHHGSHHDPILFLMICNWSRDLGIKAVRPQFNLRRQPLIVRVIKALLNRYARVLLENQVNYFGSLSDFNGKKFSKAKSIEIMVHAITNCDGIIKDLNGDSLEPNLSLLRTNEHVFYDYRKQKVKSEDVIIELEENLQ